MVTILCKPTPEVVKYVADRIQEEVQKNPRIVLGLATGATMIPIYRELARRHRAGSLSFSKATTFNLDEYVGLGPKHKNSFHYFMEKEFFSKVDLQRKNIYFLDGEAASLTQECKDYEKAIKKLGGIDLQILGIGENGHIAFNEPGSSPTSNTRIVSLTLSTRKANVNNFGKVGFVPKKALSMGIKTILSSKQILLVATGVKKRRALSAFLLGTISRRCPASYLKRHDRVEVVIDRAVAADIQKFI